MRQSEMQHRTQLLVGADGMSRLRESKVIIFGVGGVGSWCAEALIRSGIGHLTMVDSDCVAVTNCNRQLMATTRTIGQPKVEAMRERLLEINPEADIVAIQANYNAETAASFRLEEYDCIIDAIDSLADKADLILRATSLEKEVMLLSSMGAALRMDPLKVKKAEFWKVQGDALARALRNRFKREKTFPKRKFVCIYSEEVPMENRGEQMAGDEAGHGKVHMNGSICHVTAVFGMALAGEALAGLAQTAR